MGGMTGSLPACKHSNQQAATNKEAIESLRICMNFVGLSYTQPHKWSLRVAIWSRWWPSESAAMREPIKVCKASLGKTKHVAKTNCHKETASTDYKQGFNIRDRATERSLTAKNEFE